MYVCFKFCYFNWTIRYHMGAYNWTHFSILTHEVQYACACSCVNVRVCMFALYKFDLLLLLLLRCEVVTLTPILEPMRYVSICRICKCLCMSLLWCGERVSAIFLLLLPLPLVLLLLLLLFSCVSHNESICTSYLRLFFRLISFNISH